MSFAKNKLFLLAILFTTISVSTVCGYERGKLPSYIDSFWYSDSNGDGYNYPTYWDYSRPSRNPAHTDKGDCANFGSQCLIQGGFRFVSSNADDKDCIPGAESLRQYLKNKLLATEYTYLHDSIKEGDIVFWTSYDSDPDADHTLIVRKRETNDLLVAAHTNDRPGTNDPDDRISYILSGQTLVYLHIPDSPIIKNLSLKLDGTEKYKAHQEPDKFSQNPVVDKSEAISTGEFGNKNRI